MQVSFLDSSNGSGMHKELSKFKGAILKMSKLFGEVFPQMCGKQAHGKTSIVLVAYGGVSKQPD